MADATCRKCGDLFRRGHGNRKNCLRCSPVRLDTRRRSTGAPRQMEMEPCGSCGSLFLPEHLLSKYCSTRCVNRARERRRMVPCASCGELMFKSRTSRPVGEAMHNRCHPKPHGGIWQYKNGCRCDECRAGNSERAQSWQRKHSYWSRPDVVVRRKAQRSTVEAREYERSRWARYYVENRDAVVAASKAKEARRKGAPSIPFTADQLADRLSMWSGCWMCGVDLAKDFHVDHVKPLSRGGWHCLSNLRPSCGPCNLSKGAKWPLGSLTVSV